MRIIFIILVLALVTAFDYSPAVATVYYVSTSGSDAADGLTTGTAFLTLSKAVSVAVSGDIVKLKSGDTWNEQLIPVAGVTFDSYGVGDKPKLSGFQTASMSSIGGNLWTASLTAGVKTQNTILLNGSLAFKARTPNNDYDSVKSAISKTSIRVPHTTADLTGKEIVVKTNEWTIDVTRVTAVAAGVAYDTLTIAPGLSYSSAYGYFVQNDSPNQTGEYSYDSTSKLLTVYSTTTPTVKFSAIDTLVNMKKKSGVTIQNIDFEGANNYGITADSSNNNTVKNCHFKYIGYRGMQWQYNCNNFKLDRDSFSYILDGGAYSDSSLRDTITNCYFKMIGFYDGMGRNSNSITAYTGGFGHKTGLYHVGSYGQLAYNVIDSCGYIGLNFQGKFNSIYRNYVTNYCFVAQDGAGIYSVISLINNAYSQGSVIRGNYCSGGIGALKGTQASVKYAHAIYMDDNINGIWIDSNYCGNSQTFSIFNKSYNSQITNNIVNETTAAGLYNFNYYVIGTTGSFNLTVTGNTFLTTSGYSMIFTGQKDVSETINFNKYLSNTPTPLFMSYMGASSLKRWQDSLGYDLNSDTLFPSNLSLRVPTVYFNNSTSAAIVPFTATKADANNNIYRTGIYLLPHEARLLWPSSLTFNYLRQAYNKTYKIR